MTVTSSKTKTVVKLIEMVHCVSQRSDIKHERNKGNVMAHAFRRALEAKGKRVV